jgi:hypothetical protein
MIPSVSFLLSAAFISLIIAITAVIYSVVLTQPGEIFGWLYGKLYTWFNERNPCKGTRAQRGLPDHPVFKILIGCFKCVSGQWAFWFFLIYAWSEYNIFYVIPHLLFTALTIFFSLIIYKFNQYLQ